jgi:cation:H+ antiporter
MAIALFIVGIPLLVVGAELLLRGAARIAAASGIPPLIIGLTVVALATSSPEMAVSIGAALEGDGDIALGSVVGSNTLNVLLILGLSAVIAPLVVSQQLVRIDIPLVIVSSLLLLVLALDNSIGRIDGMILFAGILAYITYLVWVRRHSTDTSDHDETTESDSKSGYSKQSLMVDIGSILGGLALLVLGAQWLVDGAVDIAAVSVLASFRGQRDIAVGNVVGSNLFNLLAVVGITGIITPDGIEVAKGLLTFDIPVMTAVAIACVPIFFTGYEIARWEGWVFLGYYAAYVAYLILRATEHDLLPAFSSIMLVYVVPITLLTLAILMLRAIQNRRSGYQYPERS